MSPVEPAAAPPPTFSIVTPVGAAPADRLRSTIDSVREQRWRDWEMVVVVDDTADDGVSSVLEHMTALDGRVRVARRATVGGPAAIANDGVAAATGEFVALLDPGDRLVVDTLAVVAEWLTRDAPADVAYTDEAVVHPDGRREAPLYKPDWSPERLRSHWYTGRLTVARRACVEALGGFRPEHDAAYEHDLMLRLTERALRVVHVPEMLYLRDSRTSAPAGDGVAAVQEHCDRMGIDATVEGLPEPGCVRVRRPLRGAPLVSLVMPTRGSASSVIGEHRVHVEHALRSVLERSTHRRFELVLVVDRETPTEVVASLEELAGDRLQLVWFDGPFNFSQKMNAGVMESSGDLILMVNDDVEVVTPDWIETLVALVQEPDCGMSGAKLLYADDTLQHAGHLYLGGNVTHVYHRYPADEAGVGDLLRVERECSGVTAACAAIRREVFEEVGGFSEHLPTSFNDVDLCLKVRQRGYRVVWTPHAVLYHYESLTRVRDVSPSDLLFIRERWGHVLDADPYYNPNLRNDRADWVPARTPDAWP